MPVTRLKSINYNQYLRYLTIKSNPIESIKTNQQYKMQQIIQQYDTPPPNYNLNQHKTHGFSHSPSLPQLLSYLVITFSIIIYFTCNTSIKIYPILLVLYSIALVVMAISAAVATLRDPTDHMVYYYKWTKHDKKLVFSPEYDKVLFCQFCDSYCLANSKHCRSCNRCTDGFDHHCMWFNNCVGANNYSFFFISIISTFIYAASIIVHTILISFEIDFKNKEELLKIVFAWINAFIMTVFEFLLFNLIALHIYLKYSDQNTFSFLQRKKREEEAERRAEEIERIEKQRQKNKKQAVTINKSEESISNVNIKPNVSDVSNSTRKIQQHQNQVIRVSAKQSKVDNIFKESQEKQDESADKNQRLEEGDLTFVKENDKSSENQQKIPGFFRKNRSLKFLMPPTEAIAPSQIPDVRRSHR